MIEAGAPTDPTMELARAASRGDTAATAQLLRQLAPRLVRVVRAVLGSNHSELDDVVQQSLIRLVGALPAFRGDCEIAGYASTIAVRTALLARKRGHLARARHEDEMVVERFAANAPTPAEQFAATRRTDLLRELLAELPDEQAEAFALRIVLGFSLEEVASAASAPLNTIRSRLRLAKEALKKRIERDPSLSEALEIGS